jgi:hypothetical protein
MFIVFHLVSSLSLSKEQGMCLWAGMKNPFVFHQLTSSSSIQMSTLAKSHHLEPSDAHLPGNSKSIFLHTKKYITVSSSTDFLF